MMGSYGCKVSMRIYKGFGFVGFMVYRAYGVLRFRVCRVSRAQRDFNRGVGFKVHRALGA